MKIADSILLVEDDVLVLEVLSEALSEHTDDLVTVSTGDAAIAALRERTFTIVVSDLRLPGPNGLEVLAFARKCSALSRLVLMSGYADDAAATAIERYGGVLLHKPFGMSELIGALSHTSD